MKHRFRVLVMPKKNLLDPQGRAVKQVIRDMGIEVEEVRIGKTVYVEIKAPTEEDARSIVEKLANDVFSNPIIEDYTVEKV